MENLSFINRFFSLREKLLLGLVEKTKPFYGRFFKRSKIAWQQNLASLKKFPPKSLGKALADFLEKEGFDLMPKFESHDVYHVLLKYKTTVVDEARMQFFLLGNKKYSIYIIGASLLSMVLLPEHCSSFIKEFKKGKKAARIAAWDFQHLLSEPVEVLRKMIFRQPTKNTPVVF